MLEGWTIPTAAAPASQQGSVTSMGRDKVKGIAFSKNRKVEAWWGQAGDRTSRIAEWRACALGRKISTGETQYQEYRGE